ncbi:MAG: bifunctional methylenetetrahydrofolate dehydrogenase/methenyltetrahydrofolate cyclohydrolase FolD [Bacteroidales bacterium]|nr:bifunctional methylenetetrahydrofolate dehydrogenase/methenyltetrahydrofolate cyclohydrolase FolD [Bacteroidales bacterium]MCF8399040.1 bifunctional methylenetetrahydrofolate dehydrogenase/methenyltetrahydrofolate cyclohydrolase FolD [Bacteroidales bacterium]
MSDKKKKSIILDGKLLSNQIKEEIKAEVAQMIDREDKSPHLAAVLIGDDAASDTYVKSKEKASKAVGIISSVYRHKSDITEKELLQIVDFLNKDDEIDGFIVQLPLPDHIDENKIIEAIDPKKDIDGFHPINIGRMVAGLPAYLPATPQGIMEMLKRYEIDTEGKHCVVLGRSNIVGTPISILMSRKAKPGNATVTICHSRTKNLEAITRQADILIAAIGKPHFVKADMVKDKAVVIDVGIHRIKSEETTSGYKLVGDVDFDGVSKKCSHITPVPGGVGRMTIASLLMNTMKAAKGEVYF